MGWSLTPEPQLRPAIAFQESLVRFDCQAVVGGRDAQNEPKATADSWRGIQPDDDDRDRRGYGERSSMARPKFRTHFLSIGLKKKRGSRWQPPPPCHHATKPVKAPP
jgi:hypothetical protein